MLEYPSLLWILSVSSPAVALKFPSDRASPSETIIKWKQESGFRALKN